MTWISFWHRRATRAQIGDIELRHSWLSEAEAAPLIAKVRAAVDLLAAVSPKYHRRLVRHACGIYLYNTPGATGRWMSDLRLILLDPDLLAYDVTTVEDVAATLVHEATHGWLCSVGVNHDRDRLLRIERLCILAELDFARRVPSASDLLADIQERLHWDSSAYAAAAVLERELWSLRMLGTPTLVLRIVGALLRYRRRSAA